MMMLDNGRRMMSGETGKARSVSSTLKRFLTYFRKHWYLVAGAMVLIVAATWTQVYSPEIIGQAVDCYLFPQNPADCWFATVTLDASNADKVAGLGQMVLLLAGLYIFGSACNGLGFYLMTRAGQHTLTSLRKDLFRKTQVLTLGYYSEHEAGDVMSRVTSDADTIQQVLNFGLVQVFAGILLMLWIGFNMLTTNFAYGLISLTVVPVMFIATVYFSGQARKAFRQSRREMGSVNADLQESIAGVREVQAFNREDENIIKFAATNAANRDANVRAATFTSALTPTLEALGYIALGIVVVFGGISVLRNTPLLGTTVISLGTVFIYLQYAQRFNQPIQQIAVLWTNIQSAIAGGERIFNLIDEDVSIVDAPDAVRMPKIEGRVEFDHVYAEYKPGEPVLRDINFTAEPGEMIAIVGPTGAGKTTIINLIPRFYEVTGGAVRIDGHDVRTVTQSSLRDQIGVVLQDTFLFSETVMENIRYGRLDATDEEVIEAAKLVKADQFIQRLPEGYNTILGERGGGLSQGQRQLIAIARVALMNPRILILDEATSSVDTRTEKLIQTAFLELMRGRTTFVIAHRLSTVRNADKLMVLKAGEIVERGTHQTLLEQRGAYYDLYMSQFSKDEAMEAAQASGMGVASASFNDAQPIPGGD